ncbi:Acid phosphatase [Tolypocladium capitatum]|uniref:Acid phosphatase n=1 Tax=Tolypocladium capitatum TaxID=45235 RepID=A0A2K3QRB5_9HYPO|nr:Acid phosphatase [Tolypocladium capitatum]
MMRPNVVVLIAAALAPPAHGIRIVQSNDDGWAELYVRTLNSALRAAGHAVVLAAPAEDMSATGSRDEPPAPRAGPCEYASCPPRAGPVGSNATRPDLTWVNSFPATSIRYGIDSVGPRLWRGAAPELAVTGPNVGTNLWLSVLISGTVGAACFAAHDAGIPAIAFSGASAQRAAWDVSPVPNRSIVYAQLATALTNKIVASGKPYLPEDVFLNVNFPKVEGACTNATDFKWILSRINPGTFSRPDVEWCDSTRLPTELSVAGRDGCYISVSIGDASDKTTVNDGRQKVVLDKLRDMLVCLP